MSHGWFHRWLYIGEVDVIDPPLGPFDPRTDEQRTVTRWKDVCVDCGKERIKDVEYDYY